VDVAGAEAHLKKTQAGKDHFSTPNCPKLTNSSKCFRFIIVFEDFYCYQL